jgi:hypothetical protein
MDGQGQHVCPPCQARQRRVGARAGVAALGREEFDENRSRAGRVGWGDREQGSRGGEERTTVHRRTICPIRPEDHSRSRAAWRGNKAVGERLAAY